MILILSPIFASHFTKHFPRSCLHSELMFYRFNRKLGKSIIIGGGDSIFRRVADRAGLCGQLREANLKNGTERRPSACGTISILFSHLWTDQRESMIYVLSDNNTQVWSLPFQLLLIGTFLSQNCPISSSCRPDGSIPMVMQIRRPKMRIPSIELISISLPSILKILIAELDALYLL